MRLGSRACGALAVFLAFGGVAFGSAIPPCALELVFSYRAADGKLVQDAAEVPVAQVAPSKEIQATLLALSAGRGVQSYVQSWHQQAPEPPALVRPEANAGPVAQGSFEVLGYPIRPPVAPAPAANSATTRGQRYGAALRLETAKLRQAFSALALAKVHPLTRQFYDLLSDLEALAAAFEKSSDRHRWSGDLELAGGGHMFSVRAESLTGSGPKGMVLSSGGTMTDAPFWERVKQGEIPDAEAWSLEGYLKRFRLAGDVRIPDSLRDRTVIPLGEALYDPTHNRLFLKLVYLANIEPTAFVRPDLNLVFAVDISGSMGTTDTQAGRTRLDGALAVLRDMLRNLRDNDRVSVVIFDDKVETLIAPTRVGDVDRNTLVQSVDRVQTRNATNLAQAQTLGYQLLAQMAAANRDAQNRLVLITDAQTNTGEVNNKALTLDALRAATAAGQPLYTTVVGVGRGFDQSLSAQLASNPGGMFFYAKDGDELYRLFAQFDTRMVTFATQFSASIRLRGFPPNARVVAVHGSGIDDPSRQIASGQPLEGRPVFDVPTFAFADQPEIDPHAGGGAFVLEVAFGAP